jgi:hypothetical protein
MRNLLVLLAACGSGPPAPAQPAAPTAKLMFAATGSIGVRPDPLPPDYDVAYVVAIVDIDNPGAEIAHASVGKLQLLDASGAEVAHLRKLQETTVLGNLPPLSSSGSWAEYSDDAGPAWNGSLAHGHTRLRIRGWLDKEVLSAERIHLEIGGVVVDDVLTGSFPS